MHETRKAPVPPTTVAAPAKRTRTAVPEDVAGQVPHPAALAALQRTAGNAAVTRWVQRQGAGVREEARQHAVDPTGHGEWDTFCKDMAAAGFADEVTDAAWQLVLGGIAEQGQINDEAKVKYPAGQEQRTYRASNSWYQELVLLIGEGLQIGTDTLALWSGGRQVSDYARAKGHTPLESTAFGGVVDKLSLTGDWMLKTPMWNVLSKAFVNQARGPVHIYLRSFNPNSVLIAQEVPQLRVVMALHPEVRLVWHPVSTAADGTLTEVAKNLEPVPEASYATRDECVQVLVDHLRLTADPDNPHTGRARAEMGALLAANGNTQEQR